MLSDAEVICGFMEPRPSRQRGDSAGCPGQFWRYDRETHADLGVPARLTLDALREVEERLTGKQWSNYIARIFEETNSQGATVGGRWRHVIHASAEQKIRALAAVLRGLAPKEPEVTAEGNSSPEKGAVQGEEKR